MIATGTGATETQAELIQSLATIERRMQELAAEIELDDISLIDAADYAQAIAELQNEIEQWGEIADRPTGFLANELPRVFRVQKVDVDTQGITESFSIACDNTFQAIDAGFDRWAPDVHPASRTVCLFYQGEARKASANLRNGFAVVVPLPKAVRS